MGTDKPKGILGLDFNHNGWASISKEEWMERFPLRPSPSGGDSWDEDDLEDVPEKFIWSFGNADNLFYVESGMTTCDENIGDYFVSTMPVPDGYGVYVDYGPTKAEREEVKGYIKEWQQEGGYPEHIVIYEFLNEWIILHYPDSWMSDWEHASNGAWMNRYFGKDYSLMCDSYDWESDYKDNPPPP